MRSYYKNFFENYHLSKNNIELENAEFAGFYCKIPKDVNSILDVGSGDQKFINFISKNFFKVGLDFCFYPLYTNTFYPSVMGKLENLPFKNYSFDLVTCFEVLEHVSYQEYQFSLVELQRIAKKYIIISVPNQEILNHALVVCKKCLCHFNPSWHVRSFSPDSILNLFESFKLIGYKFCGPEISYYNSNIINCYKHFLSKNPPENSTCPQCGYIVKSSLKDNEKGCSQKIKNIIILLKNLNRKSFYILKKSHVIIKTKPYWMMATYKRCNGV